MHKNVVDAGNHALFHPQTEAHVNITDLRHRGKRDHPPDILLADRAERTEQHTAQSKYKKYTDNMTAVNNVQTDDSVKNLDQQKNVAFRH